MIPEQLTSFAFYQKKKNILLYRARDRSDRTRGYVLKSIITKDEAVRQAFYDEYESLHGLSSPHLPAYYALWEDFRYPDRDGVYLTLCMEDCSDRKPLSGMTPGHRDLLRIILRTGEILLYLMDRGILYTDLNPSNVLVTGEGKDLEVTLLDFTFCYYYARNPYPSYPLRFSYSLDPSLRGHQLLIQELALLLQEMMEQEEDSYRSSSLYFLLETGLHPSKSLYLKDYLALIEKSLI